MFAISNQNDEIFAFGSGWGKKDAFEPTDIISQRNQETINKFESNINSEVDSEC